MNSDEKTLKELAEVLDQVISSNSPAVQRHFDQLMVLLSLTRNSGELAPGPFTQMINNVESMYRQMQQMENRLTQLELQKNTHQNPFTYTTNTTASGANGPAGPWAIGPAGTNGYGSISIGPVGSSDTITLTGAGTGIDYSLMGNTMDYSTVNIDISKDMTNIEELIKNLSVSTKKEVN